jgi:alkylhydroperoxidase family enzyme
MPVVLEMFAHHLELADAFMTFTGLLGDADARLNPAYRELLILRVACRVQSGYEWAQHARMGVDAGIPIEKVQQVPHWPTAQCWAPIERTLLAAVDEMVDHFAVSDETWEKLSASFSPGQLLELLFVIGGYLCLGSVLNSVGLQGELPPEQGGFVPRQDAP